LDAERCPPGGRGAARFFKLDCEAAADDAAAGFLWDVKLKKLLTLPDPADASADAAVVTVVDGGKLSELEDGGLKKTVRGPLPPLLGLEPDRRLSDVEERDRR